MKRVLRFSFVIIAIHSPLQGGFMGWLKGDFLPIFGYNVYYGPKRWNKPNFRSMAIPLSTPAPTLAQSLSTASLALEPANTSAIIAMQPTSHSYLAHHLVTSYNALLDGISNLANLTSPLIKNVNKPDVIHGTLVGTTLSLMVYLWYKDKNYTARESAAKQREEKATMQCQQESERLEILFKQLDECTTPIESKEPLKRSQLFSQKRIILEVINKKTKITIDQKAWELPVAKLQHIAVASNLDDNNETVVIAYRDQKNRRIVRFAQIKINAATQKGVFEDNCYPSLKLNESMRKIAFDKNNNLLVLHGQEFEIWQRSPEWQCIFSSSVLEHEKIVVDAQYVFMLHKDAIGIVNLYDHGIALTEFQVSIAPKSFQSTGDGSFIAITTDNKLIARKGKHIIVLKQCNNRSEQIEQSFLEHNDTLWDYSCILNNGKKVKFVIPILTPNDFNLLSRNLERHNVIENIHLKSNFKKFKTHPA